MGLVKLRHVLLSDRQQELILLRFFGEENNPCAKLRYTKQKCPETSLLLGHLQILAHWNLFSTLAHGVVEVNSKYLELIPSVGHPTAGRLFLEDSRTLVWFVRCSGFRKTTWNFTDTLWLHHNFFFYKDTKTIKHCLKKRNYIYIFKTNYILFSLQT